MSFACTVSNAVTPSKPITRLAIARNSASGKRPPAAAPATIGRMFAPSAGIPSPSVGSAAPHAIAMSPAKEPPPKGAIETRRKNSMKHTKLAYRNDTAWREAWAAAAEKVTVLNPRVAAPPAKLAAAHGGSPKCEWCWDTGLCAECLGRYPEWCPGNCNDGTCKCAAGRARREAYQASLIEAGLG